MLSREALSADRVRECSRCAGLEITGDFLFEPAAREDFAAAINSVLDVDHMPLTGDVLLNIGERGAQVVVDASVGPLIVEGLRQVGDVAVEAAPLDLGDLAVREPTVKQLQTVEVRAFVARAANALPISYLSLLCAAQASLRIDAIASAGLGLSRSKVASIIKKEPGAVLLNWASAKSPSAKLKAGDVVSISGRGHVEIMSVATTAKGRFRVEMTRTS